MLVSALLLAFLTVASAQQPPLNPWYGYKLGIGFYRRMFIGQDFCSTRYPTCCISRDDNCYVTLRGTRCYCDQFCDREEPDCCPDYPKVCQGVRPDPTPKPGK